MTLDNLADLATLAKSIKIGCSLFFLANFNIIGAIAILERHGVTWGHMAVLAKSCQMTCNLSDADATTD